MRLPSFVLFSLLAVSHAVLFAQAPAGIPHVVAAGVKPELVQEGFVFTEGPVGSADGGLYFTDVQAKKIYRLDPSGKIAAIRENTDGANGLALNSGELYAAEGTGKLISRGNQNGRSVPIIENDARTRLEAPNDLVFDGRGGIFFTDPARAPCCPRFRGEPGKSTMRPLPRGSRRIRSTLRSRSPTASRSRWITVSCWWTTRWARRSGSSRSCRTPP